MPARLHKPQVVSQGVARVSKVLRQAEGHDKVRRWHDRIADVAYRKIRVDPLALESLASVDQRVLGNIDTAVSMAGTDRMKLLDHCSRCTSQLKHLCLSAGGLQ